MKPAGRRIRFVLAIWAIFALCLWAAAPAFAWVNGNFEDGIPAAGLPPTGWTATVNYTKPFYFQPFAGVITTTTQWPFPPSAGIADPGDAPYCDPGLLSMVHLGGYAGAVFSSRGDPEIGTVHQDWATLS
ncbi:MAG: hypothetical protein ACREKE_02335, partial [bacterium]